MNYGPRLGSPRGAFPTLAFPQPGTAVPEASTPTTVLQLGRLVPIPWPLPLNITGGVEIVELADIVRALGQVLTREEKDLRDIAVILDLLGDELDTDDVTAINVALSARAAAITARIEGPRLAAMARMRKAISAMPVGEARDQLRHELRCGEAALEELRKRRRGGA